MPSTLPTSVESPDTAQVARCDREPFSLLGVESDELLQQARTASGEQRQALLHEVIERHLPMADAIAGRYARSGPDVDDAKQVARVGLVEAASRYDPARGNFVGFAVPTIVGLLKRHFRDHSWLVRPPRSTQELSVQLRSSWPQVAQEMGSEPRAEDLAQRLQIPLEIVREALLAGVGHTAISMLADDAELPSADALRAFERCEARIVIGTALKRLSAPERELLSLRFSARFSQEEIAAVRGTNQMQVSRELTRLLAKLRALVGPIEEADGPGAGGERVHGRDRRPGSALSEQGAA